MQGAFRQPTRPSWFAAAAMLTAFCLSCQEGPSSWESHWQKGNLYFQHRDFPSAEIEIKTALKLVEREATQTPKAIRSLIGLGALYDAQRRFEEAQQHFEQAVHLIETSQGPRHPDLSMPLNYLGALHAIQHHFEIALPYFEQAFLIQESRSVSAHSFMREHIKYLAAFHASQAQYQEAEAFLSRVLEVPKPADGQIDKEAAESLDNYTRLTTAQEEYGKAKPYLEEFDQVDDGHLPKSLEESSTSLMRLANLLATEDKLAKVEGLLKGEIEKTESARGHTSFQMASALSNLADFYLAWGKFDAAIPLFERALSVIAKNSEVGDRGTRRPPQSTAPISHPDTQLAEAAVSYRETLGAIAKGTNKNPQLITEEQQRYLAVLRKTARATTQTTPTDLRGQPLSLSPKNPN